MMAEVLKWFAFFIVCLTAQTTLVPVVGVLGIQPDLPIIALFVLSLRFGVMGGVYVGFLLGLSQDLYSPVILGQGALSKAVIGFFVGLFNEKVMRTDPVLKIVILLVVFLIHDGIFAVVEQMKNHTPLAAVFPMLLTKTVPRALYSALIMTVIYLWQHLAASSSRRQQG